MEGITELAAELLGLVYATFVALPLMMQSFRGGEGRNVLVTTSLENRILRGLILLTMALIHLGLALTFAPGNILEG